MAGLIENSKDKWLNHRTIVTWVVFLLMVGFVVLVAGWTVYAYNIAEYGISNDPAAWGQLGDFIDGVSNPTLAF